MRRSCLLVLCWGLILLGCVQCSNEYFIESPIRTEIAGFSLEEAQAYFEEEASQPSAKKRLWEKSSKATLVPGDFIPEWESATGAERNGTACYNVPITGTTYRFIALVKNGQDSLKYKAKVNVWQKLVIVKNLRTSNMSQYILTLVPTPEYEAQYGTEAAKEFMNCGYRNHFSGLAIFTLVYVPFPIEVCRYEDGKLMEKVFVPNAREAFKNKKEAYEPMRAMLSPVSIRRVEMQ